MKKISLTAVLFLLLVSCNPHSSKTETALEAAGENRAALEKVLDFYKSNPADSLKYKAAIFLIENLPYRFSRKSIPGYEKAFDSIKNYPFGKVREIAFRKIFKVVPKDETFDISEMTPDIQQLSYSFLTKNIDQSFAAWNKIPKDKRGSFEEFCQYILPYKSANEPFEEGVREKLSKKYAWAAKNLKAGASLQTVVDSIAADFNFVVMNDISKLYPQKLSISEVEKVRFGTCSDGVNYLVNVFRSLGIVCATDMVTHWGNHPTIGHSWLYVRFGNQEYATDVRGKIDLKALYAEESIPKIQRESYLFQKNNPFSPLTEYLTNSYGIAVDIAIPNLLEAPHAQPVLCVFDVNREWAPITYGNFKSDNFTFDNIGVNVMYMAGSQEENGIAPANYPFYIDKSKKLHFFKPKSTTVNDVVLTRKCRLSSARNRKAVLELMSSLNGCLFQGSNNADFSDAVPLYQITNFKSNHLKKVVLKSKKKFKYVRFFSNGKKTSLATLAFYNDKGQKLKGEVIQENLPNFIWNWSAFDEDPLTYSMGANFSLGFAFKNPTTISTIEFQVQNDMNHIVAGNEYELFYWNKQWKTLGVQVAKDTLLEYAKVPENALFWLRNNTGGKEEQVFMIDKNKRQNWLGSDNY